MKLGTYFKEEEQKDIEWTWEGVGYLIDIIVDDERIGCIDIDELISLGEYFKSLKKLNETS